MRIIDRIKKLFKRIPVVVVKSPDISDEQLLEYLTEAGVEKIMEIERPVWVIPKKKEGK